MAQDSFLQLVKHDAWRMSSAKLPFMAWGSDKIEPWIFDLAVAPHLLVAGSLDTGRLQWLDSLIAGWFLKSNPVDLKLIFIDSIITTFYHYRQLPHLLLPIITDCNKAVEALQLVIDEIEHRHLILAEAGVNNIDDYVKNGKTMTRIVIIISELADFMRDDGEWLKTNTQSRLLHIIKHGANVGVHLVASTQILSKDVITEELKTNFPAKLSFSWFKVADSMEIMGVLGAEKILTRDEMLLVTNASTPAETALSLHSVLVLDDEISHIIAKVSAYSPPPRLIGKTGWNRQKKRLMFGTNPKI